MLVDAGKIADVKVLLEKVIEYIASTNMNNNELKEMTINLHRSTGVLKDAVMQLPPQGRIVGFDAEVTVKAESHLGRTLQHIMEKKRRG